MLSLGLAIIFGLLNVINFLRRPVHGGAFIAWMLLAWAGLSYWVALLVTPLVVAISAVFVEAPVPAASLPSRPSLRHAATFGLMLMVEGLFARASARPGFPIPMSSPAA